MKGTKFVASAVIAGMMVTGAGYAYWTDALTVDNTVSTGELNVAFDDSKTSIASAESGTEYVVVEETPGSDGKSYEFSVSNLYPGASVKVSTAFTNTGTIPAVIDDSTFSFDNALSVAQRSKMLLEGGTISILKADNSTQHSYTIPSGQYNINDAGSVIENYAGDYQLEPGDSVVLSDLEFTMDPSTVEADDLEDKTFTFQIGATFKQHNAQ